MLLRPVHIKYSVFVNPTTRKKQKGMKHAWGNPYPVDNGGPTYAHHQKCKACGATATRYKKGRLRLHEGQSEECVVIDSPCSTVAETTEEEAEREVTGRKIGSSWAEEEGEGSEGRGSRRAGIRLQ